MRCKLLVGGLLFFCAILSAGAASPIEVFLNRGRALPFYGTELPSDPMQISFAVRRSQLAERMAEVTNSALLLRRDLQVGFRSCGEPRAFFDPQSSAIVICYEFVEMVGRLAARDDVLRALPKEQFIKTLDGAIWSVYMHELAHAAVVINRIPVTGRSEDVADQFGTWFVLNFLPVEQASIVVSNLWLWHRLAQEREFLALSAQQRRQVLADEHSLNEQRVYNIACMLVGAVGPGNAQELISAVELPASRAERCPAEYAQIDYAMRTSFRKFVKVRPRSGAW